MSQQLPRRDEPDAALPLRYAAVILYYKLGPLICETISRLQQQTYPPTEIHVVDNDSNDRILETAFVNTQVRVSKLPVNAGYSGGMVHGESLVSEEIDYILFMTHEVQLEPDCVQHLAKAINDGTGNVLVGPALTKGIAGPVWSYGGAFAPYGAVRHIVESDSMQKAEWLDGACLLVDRSVYKRIGGFDTDYFLYWEDVDISVRMNTAGRITCVREARGSQETGYSPTYFKTRNQILFWRKQKDPWKVWQSVALFVIKVVVRDAPKRDWAAVKARLSGIKHGFDGRLNKYLTDVRVS